MKQDPTDTQLLNWLDRQGRYYKWNVQLPKDYPHVKDCVFIQRNSTAGEPDIRSAIIAAMQREEVRK
jgi:hypothetical protein